MSRDMRFTTIPASFRYILPVISAVTGVAVYASVFVFKIPSLCFILAIVGAGLQFFLGIYCCFLGAKVGVYHRFVVPLSLVACAGIWAAPLYYFVGGLTTYLDLQKLVGTKIETDQLTWRAVGLGTSALNIILNLVLLAIFFVKGNRRPQQQVRHSQTVYHAVAQQPAAQPATTSYYNHNPSAQYVAPVQEYKPARTYTTLSSVPSTTSPAPYNYSVSTTSPGPNAYNNYSASPPPQAQPLPQASELAAPATTPYTDRTNRIEVLRRIGQLQFGDGHWEYTPELQDLVSAWQGGLGDGTPVAVTAGVAVLINAIVEGVWAIQREGREATSLSAGETESLVGMGWDLRWAKGGADNGNAWVRARS